MGFQSTALAFAVPDLSGPQKAVLVALAHCKNEQSGKCNPSHSTLGRMTSLSEKTVRRALEELAAQNLIGRRQVLRDRARVGTSYSLNLAAPLVTETSGQSDQRSESPEGVVTESATSGQSDHQTRRENKKRTGSTYTSEFDEFWTVYPRKEQKADAAKAYQAAIKHTDPDIILKGAQKYTLAKIGAEPRYVKLAGGWLRGRMWEDEPTVSQPADDWQPGRNNFAWHDEFGGTDGIAKMLYPSTFCELHDGYPADDCRRCDEEQMEGAA